MADSNRILEAAETVRANQHIRLTFAAGSKYAAGKGLDREIEGPCRGHYRDRKGRLRLRLELDPRRVILVPTWQLDQIQVIS